MSSTPQRPQNISKNLTAIYAIQTTSILAFAILFSTLVLYMTQKMGLSAKFANAIMGGFVAFRYGLHLLGGYFSGRWLSNRKIFSIGVLLQILACFFLMDTSLNHFYLGLSCFLLGVGLNMTCINMILTQLFDAKDKRRESAFLINYSFMNIGFLLGYSLAGYFQLKQDFLSLFWICITANLVTLFLTFCSWSLIKDYSTQLIEIAKTHGKKKVFTRSIIGLVLIMAMIPVLNILLQHIQQSNAFVLIISGVVFALLFILSFSQRNKSARDKMLAYIIFAIGALAFWTLYDLVPMGLTLFAQYNVDRVVMGIEIAPQWIQEVNSIIIILGGPLSIIALKAIRKRYYFSLPQQFALAIFLIGSGYLLLNLGIHFANAQGYVDFIWIVLCYVFQSFGELMIGPIGYAMIGQLAPEKLQGIMMGSWMMVVGAGGVLASYSSNSAISSMHGTNPLTTNPGYGHVFGSLGLLAVIVSLVMALLMPKLKHLIHEK